MTMEQDPVHARALLSSRHRERAQQLPIDQPPEVARQGRGQRAVANEEPYLDVAVKGGLCEFGRSHEPRLVVGHNALT